MALDFSYQGNAEIGLGSNPGIPAIDSAPLSVINQTGRDLMLLNHENNIKLYEQKQKDRAKQLEAIDSGQVATGEILDSDRPVVKKYQDEVNREFEKFVKAGGVKNPEAYRNYQNKVTGLKDAVTHAQYRYVGRKTLEKDRADQKIKRFQDDYDSHLKSEDGKDFWGGDYSPYQHALTLNIDNITKKSVTNPYEFISDDKGVANLKGTFKTTGNRFDYGKTKAALTGAYLENDEDMFDQKELLNSIEKLEPQKKIDTIKYMNDAIDKYNTKYGYVKGVNPEFVDQVVISPQTGQIAEHPVDFSAKWDLSHNSDTEKTVLDEKAADRDLKKQALQEKTANDKELRAQGWAKIQTARDLARAKIKGIDNQFNPAQTFDEMFKGRMETYKTTNGNTVTRVNAANIPKAFMDNLGLEPLNKNGDYNIVPANIKYNGKSVGEDEVQKMYESWLTSDAGKKLEGEIKKKPNIFDFMYANGATFEPEVEGKIAPIYKDVKQTTKQNGVTTTTTVKVLQNPDEAGKLRRSNRLQSWINQRKQLGVKGDKLLMEQDSQDDTETETAPPPPTAD